MSGVFVAYRKADAGAWASLLGDQLAASFGRDRVFLDAGSLEPGAWQQQIEAALARSSVVLVVIGQRWLHAADNDGTRLLWKPGDVHRREVEIALARPVAVIPILVGGAEMPRKEELPPSIAALADWQARPLSEVPRHRASDLQTLMSDIHKADASLTPAPSKHPAVAVRLLALLGASLGLVAMTVVGTIALLVGARVAFGWTFRTEDVPVVAMFVFLALFAAAWVRTRIRPRPYAGG